MNALLSRLRRRTPAPASERKPLLTKTRRGVVRSLELSQLDDGRWQVVVVTITPSGKRGRITVAGTCYVPCVDTEPWIGPSLILEFVPVPALEASR